MALQFVPLGEEAGVEVRGIDPREPVTGPDLETLLSAWRDNLVLLIRGTVLTDPERSENRSKPSHHQHRFDHGDRHRVPWQYGPNTQQRGTVGGDPQAEWLQHWCFWQMARNRGLGDERVRPL